MVRLRIPLKSVHTQRPFSSPKTQMIQMLSAFFRQIQASDFTLCKPSSTHELLWALGMIMSDQMILEAVDKGMVA